MLYLNESMLRSLHDGYATLIDVIADATRCVRERDFAQPIKPYLRYRDPKNRIIAMPAFVGGEIDAAGIKWIASFPDNIFKNKPRAHSVVVLNDAATGEPTCIINTPLLSIFRTAAVSGLMLRCFEAARGARAMKLGIAGWGPIGRAHHAMCSELLGERLVSTTIYDVRPEATTGDAIPAGVHVARSWREAYDDADLFISCTVADQRYIDAPPKSGSLQLNVSLRDYTSSVFDHVRRGIVVDDWDEVCRESTDIEIFHKERGLAGKDVMTLDDVVCTDALSKLAREQVVMFNPMGMAVFDIAVAAHFSAVATRRGAGQRLD